MNDDSDLSVPAFDRLDEHRNCGRKFLKQVINIDFVVKYVPTEKITNRLSGVVNLLYYLLTFFGFDLFSVKENTSDAAAVCAVWTLLCFYVV